MENTFNKVDLLPSSRRIVPENHRLQRNNRAAILRTHHIESLSACFFVTKLSGK